MIENRKQNSIRMIVITGLCIALCVVLPFAFHMFPNGGSIFCPMHIPVLLCGLICGWQYGLLCGITGPLLSSLLTGMPPAPILPGMMVELAVYGIVASLMMKLVQTKSTYADLYISLITAMLAGRVISGIAKALIISPPENMQAFIVNWATASFVTALPGIIIHLALIPSLVFALQKAKLIPNRYPKASDGAVKKEK